MRVFLSVFAMSQRAYLYCTYVSIHPYFFDKLMEIDPYIR